MKGNCRNISKDTAGLLAFSFFLMAACSEPRPELKAKLNLPNKEVKVKKNYRLVVLKCRPDFSARRFQNKH